jgi:hypothetical protein
LDERISLIGPKFPCSASKLPLFPAEQRIHRNTLILRRDPAPAPRKASQNAQDFEKFADKFPDGRETASTARRAAPARPLSSRCCSAPIEPRDGLREIERRRRVAWHDTNEIIVGDTTPAIVAAHYVFEPFAGDTRQNCGRRWAAIIRTKPFDFAPGPSSQREEIAPSKGEHP